MAISVHLRQRKQSAKGQFSLYLEFYKGTTKSADGKVKPVREYEYLNLYLKDKPKNTVDKQQNKQILELAKSIKAKRELEIKNGQYGFRPDFKQRTSFLEYFQKEVEKRAKSDRNYGNWRSCFKHLQEFIRSDYHQNLTFSEVDERFCEAFKTYLSERARTSADQPLKTSSQSSYFAKLRAAMRQAVRDKILSTNPAESIPLPKVVSSKREYLTIEELRILTKVKCRYDVLKRAFLFSCLTGLRWSDIHNLKWRGVQQYGDGFRIVFHQQKTKGLQYLDISSQARELLGEEGHPEERVFIGLRYSTYMNTALMQWMLKAGITKDITFHCGRHTFAVLQLNYGTDIFTLSKMLGHSEIKTTMIYSQIMDQKKIEAANRIPTLNL